MTEARTALLQWLSALQRKTQEYDLYGCRRNQGKGYAVKTGMLKASGKLRLFADADGATPIMELAELKKAIETGADVAVGSRALRG